MNQFQIICGMKPLKCPSDVYSIVIGIGLYQFCPSTIGETHKEYKEGRCDSTFVRHEDYARTGEAMSKRTCEVCFIEKLCHLDAEMHKRG
jgi:hypothetical protein